MKYFVVILLLVSTLPLKSQEISFGGAIGFTYENANFQNLPNLENCCDNYSTTFGNQLSINFSLETQLFNESFFLTPSFITKSVSFTKDIEEVINIGGDPYNGLIRHSLNTESQLMNFDFGYTNKVLKYIDYRVGVSAGYLLRTTAKQKETLIIPENIGVFENGTRTRNEGSEEYSNLNILFGLNMGLSRKFELDNSNRLFLEPFTNIRYYLNDNFDGINWNTGFVEAGVSITYSFKDVILKERVLPDPEIDLIAFKTDDTYREKLKDIELEYVLAKDILSGESFYLFMKPDYKISYYVYVKNLLERQVNFRMYNEENETIYNDNLESNNFSKEFSPLTLPSITSSDELKLQISVIDSTGTLITEDRVYNIIKNNVDNIDIISTNVIDKTISDYIDNDTERGFTFYTNEANILENIQFKNPNVVIKKMNDFPFLLEKNKIKKIFIVID